MELSLEKSQIRFCAICGPSAKKRVKYSSLSGTATPRALDASAFNSRDAFRNNYFPFVECKECGIIFADPAPDPELIRTLYEHSTIEYSNLEPWIYKVYVALLNRAMRFVPDRDSFVEIGGDIGLLLGYAVENGFRKQIEIEPSEDARKKFVPPSSSARFICDVFREGMLKENSVSLVSFFHVLDHIPDPGAFLKEAFRALKPGGIAIAAAHNAHAISAKILGKRSPIYNISHSYLFNPANIKTIFEKAGFEVIDISPYANTYPLWYWMRDVDFLRSLKMHLLNVLEKMGVSNVPLKLFAGNMAIIAKKPLDKRDKFSKK